MEKSANYGIILEEPGTLQTPGIRGTSRRRIRMYGRAARGFCNICRESGQKNFLEGKAEARFAVSLHIVKGKRLWGRLCI